MVSSAGLQTDFRLCYVASFEVKSNVGNPAPLLQCCIRPGAYAISVQEVLGNVHPQNMNRNVSLI